MSRQKKNKKVQLNGKENLGFKCDLVLEQTLLQLILCTSSHYRLNQVSLLGLSPKVTYTPAHYWTHNKNCCFTNHAKIYKMLFQIISYLLFGSNCDILQRRGANFCRGSYKKHSSERISKSMYIMVLEKSFFHF